MYSINKGQFDVNLSWENAVGRIKKKSKFENCWETEKLSFGQLLLNKYLRAGTYLLTWKKSGSKAGRTEWNHIQPSGPHLRKLLNSSVFILTEF